LRVRGLDRQDHRFLRLECRRADADLPVAVHGAMGKSAQFLLHTWLPDAMEGPTPVSALIHAATNGHRRGLHVARLSPLFELAPNAPGRGDVLRRHHRVLRATIGLVQNDIKRIVAIRPVRSSLHVVAMGQGPIPSAVHLSRTPSSRPAVL